MPDEYQSRSFKPSMDIIILIHRIAHKLHAWRVPLFPAALYLVNRMCFGIVLPPPTQVGKRVRFAYMGLGTVIHGRVIIEDDVVIASNVTIGGRSRHDAVPVLRRGAYIGTGARVLGPIEVGENAVVGANAVVLADVPNHAVVAGVPARVVRENIGWGEYR